MLLFCPSPQREDMAALVAFNLELARVREQVTEPTLGLIRLQWWREAIEEIAAGRDPRRHQVIQALAGVIRRHRLDHRLLLGMIDARESELDSIASETYAQFLHLADSGPGNLLSLCLSIMGIDPNAKANKEAVQHVAHAYAIAGLLRSLLVDARSRHLRLPADRIKEAGVSLDQLFDLKPQPELQVAVTRLAEAGRAELAETRRLKISRAAIPLTLTARLASLQLSRLGQHGHDVFDARSVATHPFDVWRLAWTRYTGQF